MAVRASSPPLVVPWAYEEEEPVDWEAAWVADVGSYAALSSAKTSDLGTVKNLNLSGSDSPFGFQEHIQPSLLIDKIECVLW